MKKILLVLAFVLGITCCSHSKIAYPSPKKGAFRPKTGYTQAQSILYKACSMSGWRVLNKDKNRYKINYNHHGYEFIAIIQYTKTNYTISFNRIKHHNGNIHVAYGVYNDNAAKLNRTIQKYAARIR